MTNASHPSLWVRESEDLPASSSSAPHRADVVVIGGGVAGTSATVALARRGVDVVLLEAGSIAGRASGRNDGQVLLGLGEHYNRIVGQFGADGARKLWDYIHHNHDRIEREVDALGLDCGWHRSGGLRLAETEHEQSELVEAAELMRAEGFEHELLGVSDVREILPAAREFHGALRLPGEAVVQPARLVRGLARGARTAGATILEGHVARRVDAAGSNGVHRVALRDRAGIEQVIECSVVVHCTSALGDTLSDGALDPSGFLGKQVFPFRGQILATDPLPSEVAAEFGGHEYAMSSNFCYEYFRMHGGRFVVGGMRWSVSGEEQGLTDDDSVNDTVSRNLLDYVHKHFPSLVDTAFPHRWTGIMAGTQDGLPLCGALPGQPGVFALLGFNGYGLSFACEAGATVADQIVDGKADHPAVPMFAPRRFR